MKILVIGCGSIGGYLINELAKQGYENLTIMDNDILCEENIFRHVLGLEYIAKNKAEALKEFIRKNIPEMYINSKNEKIQDYLYDDENDLNDFDLIISTVGNHNVNRWLNSYIYAKKVLTPVIYAWNEVYGIRNHVAFIKYQNIGCYNCFFGRDEDTDELYDKTSYCKPGQMIARHVYGCDHSFIPYGNSVSLKTVLVCIDVINEFNENNNMENFIISIKGNDRYFREQGLEATTKYKNQNELVKKITGDLFINKGCGVCKNDNI